MIIITNPTATRIKASAYELDVTPDGISVIIAGESIAVLNPHTALDITEGETGFIPDEDCGDVTFNRTYAGSDKAIFEWTCKSSLWEKKTTILTCLEDRFEYSTAVCGNGTVDSVNYFLTRKDGPLYRRTAEQKAAPTNSAMAFSPTSTSAPATVHIPQINPSRFTPP